MARPNIVPSAEKRVYILGSMSMQNELLANFLSESTGAECVTGTSVEELPADGAGGAVILWDCQGMTSKSILAEIQNYPVEKHVVLLFNLSREAVVERDVVNKGVRGFIYEHENFARLPKAIHAVHNGELWLSREFMSKWILATKGAGQEKNGTNGLTAKQVQILRLIAEGASNKDIAEKLFISTNTAKTHLYQIYKKIKVTSRLQAAVWARENL